MHAYTVPADDCRFPGWRVMFAPATGDAYRHAGTLSTKRAAERAVKRIEAGELPADVLRDEREGE